MKTVDARGLSCPEPVLRTRNALTDLPKSDELEVLVETVSSRENVRRMAESKGFDVRTEEIDDGFRLLIAKS